MNKLEPGFSFQFVAPFWPDALLGLENSERAKIGQRKQKGINCITGKPSAVEELRKPFKSRSAKTEEEFSTEEYKENFSWGKRKKRKTGRPN